MNASDTILNHLSTTMHFLYRHPQTSRVEIASKTGLTKALITHTISTLLESGLVYETGAEVRKQKGSGKARKVIALSPEAACVIGIEINMERLCLVRTSLNGQIEETIRVPLRQIDRSNINEEIAKRIKDLAKNAHSRLLGIGIGVPGHHDQQNDRIITNNPAWSAFRKAEIERLLDLNVPIYIENNIECMAYGRYLFQPQATPDEFILLHVGPGVYCSFFDAAMIGRKKSDYFGEIGHSVIDINGTLCECGKRGCLQTYIAHNWLLQRASIYYANGSSSVLLSLAKTKEDLSIQTLIEAYRLHDPYVRTILEDGLDRLAITISNLLIVNDASQIFMNSEVLQEPLLQHYFLEKMREQFRFILNSESVPVEILNFRSDRGAQGACALALYERLINHSDPDAFFCEQA